jgi:outer membrane protein TolC
VQPLSEIPIPDSVAETVEEAVDHALDQRPDLLSDISGIRAANADRKQARAAFYPSFGLSVIPKTQSLYFRQQQLPWGHTADLTGSMALSLNWTVFDGGARRSRLSQADAQLEGVPDAENRTRASQNGRSSSSGWGKRMTWDKNRDLPNEVLKHVG